MSKPITNILVVATSTLGSRVLGLLRDILMLSLLGLSTAASAFIFAFTIPNLFRRLLGEGALTSAFIPVLSGEFREGGRSSAFIFANRVFSRAGATLLALVILGVAAYMLVSLLLWRMPADNSAMREQWLLGCLMGILLIPYMLFVCMSAVLAGALNVLERFAIPALSAVWLNLAMIGFLAFGGWGLGWRGETLALWLCGGVLLGGVMQLAIPGWALWRLGWKPKLDFSSSPAMRELESLFVPGVLGAAILQINVLVSRLLAFSLDDSAVSVLYLANRLVELPLGVFAIAIATVLFPRLSLLAAGGESAEIARAYSRGLRLILAITLPAAAGLAMLRDPIVTFLFAWGHFDAADVSITSPVILLFALALPFYAMSTFIVRGFHALKDTRTPVRVAWRCFLINFALSLALMMPLGVTGLAMANLLAAVYQTMALNRRLAARDAAWSSASGFRSLGRIGLAVLLMAAVLALGTAALGLAGLPAKTTAGLAVVILIPVGAAVYFAALWALRFEERQAVRDLCLRWLPLRR